MITKEQFLDELIRRRDNLQRELNETCTVIELYKEHVINGKATRMINTCKGVAKYVVECLRYYGGEANIQQIIGYLRVHYRETITRADISPRLSTLSKEGRVQWNSTTKVWSLLKDD